MLDLKDITLFGLDCIDFERLRSASDKCLQYAAFDEVKLLSSLDVHHPHLVKIPPVTDIEQYSKFMITELVDYISTNYVLCIQWDGFILNPHQWTDEYLEYDYIGAPWAGELHNNVGNGGFSLRSKKFLTECSKMPTNLYHPEDVVCCVTMYSNLKDKGVKFAPEKLAHKFSHEGNPKYGWVWQGSFGFHSFIATDISNVSH